jgi:hypothetical protein
LKADEVVKSVENPQLVAGDEQQSSLSEPPPATQDPNLSANPQEDPNLFQLSSSTEQKQPEQTNDETTPEGATVTAGCCTSIRMITSWNPSW